MRLGLVEPLIEQVRDAKIPLLGVCLGAQLLTRESAEGTKPGIGLIDAECHRFIPNAADGIRVPHMGWGHLDYKRESPITTGLDAMARFYFVHSFYIVCADQQDVVATSRHGAEFTAIMQCGNIYGAQFHPEKSHRFGMQLLKNFVEM